MFSVNKPLLVLTSAFVAAGNSFAQWDGGIEAGARLGGDDGPALRFFARNQSTPLSHYLFLDWIRDSGGSNYRVGYNPTYKISESVYSFGRFSIEDDDPSAIDRELDAQIGLGNNLFRRGNTRVIAEAGVGARQLTFDDNSDSSEDGFVFLGGRITSSSLPVVRFDASINAQAGSDQTTLDGEAGISVPITGGVFLRYAYTVTRFDIDGVDDNIITEDSFVTLTYDF